MKIKQTYKYWEWLLLSKHTTLVEKQEKRGVIAIHNPIENKIYRYDFNKKKYKDTNWNGLDWLFENRLSEFLTIGELEEFYLSLPKKKQNIFWDCLSYSMNRKNKKKEEYLWQQ